MLFSLLPLCAGMLERSGDRRKIHRKIILLVNYPLGIVLAPQELGAIGLHLKDASMISQIGLKITLRPTRPIKMHTDDEGNTCYRLRIWYTTVDDPTSATTPSALPSSIVTMRFQGRG